MRFLAPLVFALSACAGASASDAGSVDVFAGPGPFPIGVAHVELTSSDGGRSLPVEVWYPAAPSTPATAPASGWPLLVFSHCTECFRFSFHSVTERLASHGFVVAAPDHVDNTRFDASAAITNAFLAVRAGDVSDVIDAMLDASDPRVPASLRGHRPRPQLRRGDDGQSGGVPSMRMFSWLHAHGSYWRTAPSTHGFTWKPTR